MDMKRVVAVLRSSSRGVAVQATLVRQMHRCGDQPEEAP